MWSEWQAPFEARLSPTWAFLSWNDDDGTSLVQEIQNPWQGGVTVTDSARSDGRRVTTAVQFTAPTQWDTYRDDRPPALDAMVEGVDYSIVPGRQPWEAGAFVEYDPAGANDHAGWGDPETVPHILTVSGQGSTPTTPWRTQAVVGFDLGTRYPEEPFTTTIGGRPALDVVWGDGSAGGVGQVTQAEHYNLGAFPDWALGNALSFTMFVQAVSESFEPPNGASGAGLLEVFQPYQRVILPRWRYWIPDRDIPLRQRQRDDGLGLSPNRWRRGTSRQASNRWSSYL